MDTTRTITREPVERSISDYSETAKRLDLLLAENERFEKIQSIDASEAFNASLIKNPVDTETAVARLGLLTGIVPTSALFIKMFLIDGSGPPNAMAALAFGAFLAVVVAATSATGYLTGKSAGHILKLLEEKEWSVMLFALPFVGAVWGLISGAAGGVLLFGIGAIFGGAIGLAVGAFVYTAFGIIHRLLKTTDKIERNQLIPISVGIVSVIAAVILGM